MAGLYVHVPFCRSKCAYCDFYSLPRISEFADRYARAVVSERQLRQPGYDAPATVYFGGGTPSTLSAAQFEGIVDGLELPSDIREFTVEVNPEDINADILGTWKALGVNRLSMGVQSFDDSELKAVGRRHDSARALKAYEDSRKSFDNVSLDFIVGLPGQTLESLDATLRKAITLRPEHLSVYILGYEPGTRLHTLRAMGKITETDDETLTRMYTLACDRLNDAGYDHYEISNFALPGMHARHNSSYWDGTPYLGLGPAAHSYDGVNRYYNPTDIRKWLDRTERGETCCETDALTPRDRVNELIMTSLRTAKGLDLSAVSPAFLSRLKDDIDNLPPGRVEIKNDTIKIPEQAWLLSDDTISRLFIAP